MKHPKQGLSHDRCLQNYYWTQEGRNLCKDMMKSILGQEKKRSRQPDARGRVDRVSMVELPAFCCHRMIRIRTELVPCHQRQSLECYLSAETCQNEGVETRFGRNERNEGKQKANEAGARQELGRRASMTGEQIETRF